MGKVTRGHGDTIEKGDAMHGKDDFVIKPKREEIVEIKASRSSENVGFDHSSKWVQHRRRVVQLVRYRTIWSSKKASLEYSQLEVSFLEL